MPLGSALLMRHQARHITPADSSPGDRYIPILGSARHGPKGKLGRLILEGAAPFYGGAGLSQLRPKLSAALLSSFTDEMAKLAFVPNTEGDKAGVLRALLVAMVSRQQFLSADTPDADRVMEQRLMYGGEEGRQSYAQAVQDKMTRDLLADTKLRAAIKSMEDDPRRYVS